MSHVDSSWFDDYFAKSFGALVWRACRSYGVLPEDAKDLVQQAFIELYRSGRDGTLDIGSTAALEAFMWKRITYRVLTHFKRNPSRFNISDSTEILPSLMAPPTSSSSPELAWEEQNGWKAVLELVSDLPVRQRQHVALVAHGYKPQERADMLGISHVAERVAWYRLRRRLADIIEPGSGNGEETA